MVEGGRHIHHLLSVGWPEKLPPLFSEEVQYRPALGDLERLGLPVASEAPCPPRVSLLRQVAGATHGAVFEPAHTSDTRSSRRPSYRPSNMAGRGRIPLRCNARRTALPYRLILTTDAARWFP